MSYDFNNAKSDALDRPSSKAWSSWSKFEKVGDKAQGYIRDVFFRPAEGIYKEARGITLEQPDGTLVNVSIKRFDFILEKTDNLRLGDPLTVIFEAELPAKKAGYNPTKQFGFYGKNLEENKGNKTVKELEDEDLGIESKKAVATKNADADFAQAGNVVMGSTTEAVPPVQQ